MEEAAAAYILDQEISLLYGSPSALSERDLACKAQREGEERIFLHRSLQSRGSDNPNTGPIRDHSSFTSNRVTGAFAYIDASPPRRPNDVAQIVSEEFTATGANREGKESATFPLGPILLSRMTLPLSLILL